MAHSGCGRQPTLGPVSWFAHVGTRRQLLLALPVIRPWLIRAFFSCRLLHWEINAIDRVGAADHRCSMGTAISDVQNRAFLRDREPVFTSPRRGSIDRQLELNIVGSDVHSR